jgi:hypothetical protein
MATLQGQQGVNSKTVNAGTVSFGEMGELLATELMPRYYEANYKGLKYACSTAGGGVAAAAVQLFSTTFATWTPILAIYNPISSTVNLVINQVYCGLSAAPIAAPAQTGAYLLVAGTGQSLTNAQSTTAVINLKTLKAVGSQAIAITNTTLIGALPTTGLPLVLRPLTGLINLVTASANVSGLLGGLNCDNIDGSILVPPGAFLGIAMGISNAVATHFTTAGFVWDEIAT